MTSRASPWLAGWPSHSAVSNPASSVGIVKGPAHACTHMLQYARLTYWAMHVHSMCRPSRELEYRAASSRHSHPLAVQGCSIMCKGGSDPGEKAVQALPCLSSTVPSSRASCLPATLAFDEDLGLRPTAGLGNCWSPGRVLNGQEAGMDLLRSRAGQ